jgi:hypothetical protein
MKWCKNLVGIEFGMDFGRKLVIGKNLMLICVFSDTRQRRDTPVACLEVGVVSGVNDVLSDA